MAKKVSISISISKDIDDYLSKCANKIINIDGTELETGKSKNQLYNDALEYAMENMNEWFRTKKEKE